jgi:hypothetical protein
MNQKVAVGVVFVAAMFMSIMDATIVNVALPTIGRDFKVSATAVDTISIGFLVSLAVFIPASGWLGDRLGGKRVLLTATALFTAASALCGLASSLGELVAFRILQGAAGGMLAPVGMAMLYRTFPPSGADQGRGHLDRSHHVRPGAGPVLGGLLVTDLSWRWVFYVNLPLGAAAFAFGLLFPEPQEQDRPGRFDLAGFLLSGLGLGLLMYGVSEGPNLGWHEPDVLATIAAGIVLLAAMVAVELKSAAPMVDLRLLGNRLFRSGNGVRGHAVHGPGVRPGPGGGVRHHHARGHRPGLHHVQHGPAAQRRGRRGRADHRDRARRTGAPGRRAPGGQPHGLPGRLRRRRRDLPVRDGMLPVHPRRRRCRHRPSPARPGRHRAGGG